MRSMTGYGRGSSEIGGRRVIVEMRSVNHRFLEVKLRGAFAKAGTGILGVSADPVAAQGKFKSKHKLKIALGSDESKKMLQAYGAWGEKSMYGRKFMGVIRKTFLIDKSGRIARIWPKVKVEGHAKEVLEAARAL